jgi:hypothetical protein
VDCQRHSQGGCTAGLCLEGPGRQHGHLRSWGGTTACFCCWWCPTTVVPLLLQENILFGQQYNKERYQAVLRACALEGGRVPPLLLLPAALYCGSQADSRLSCRCCLPQKSSTVQLMLSLSACLPCRGHCGAASWQRDRAGRARHQPLRPVLACLQSSPLCAEYRLSGSPAPSPPPSLP